MMSLASPRECAGVTLTASWLVRQLLNGIFMHYGASIMFLAPSLAFSIVYVWSRRNPSLVLNFLGLFTFTAPYLPWVILAFGYLLNQSPLHDLLGIGVGHIYYYLDDVYPKLRPGRRIFFAPTFLYVALISLARSLAFILAHVSRPHTASA